MQVNSIIIVGGGSSGWFTASILNKHCPEIDVTLIESPNVSTIGVGESTVLNINWFLLKFVIIYTVFMLDSRRNITPSALPSTLPTPPKKVHF